MTKKKTPAAKTPNEAQPEPNPEQETRVEETPFEAVASICSVLVVGLFILTFLAQNFVIPSGSMEKTLLVGDHLVVDRITLAPDAKWMPLVRYREPRRGDVVVFIKPVADDVDGKPEYLFLVKRLIGVPGTTFICAMASSSLTAWRKASPRTGWIYPRIRARRFFSTSSQRLRRQRMEAPPKNGPWMLPATSWTGIWWFRRASTS